jgi:LCP family protein required for cell wall assembly
MVRLAVVSVSTLAVAATAIFGYLILRLNTNIRTYDSTGVSPSRPPAPTAKAAAGQPAAQPPINLLLIGSDTRAGNNIDLGGGSDVQGARSDTAILLHIAGDRKHAIGVSIPRDSLVDIPACEANGQWLPPQTRVMFNSAFAEGNLPAGNPICAQNTVESLSGIRIDHTIVVDFSGFASLSSAVGGVTVCVPPVNNVYLEHQYAITLNPGIQTLSGQAAVEYVRAREGFGDNSDIGRIKRQQAFMSALAKKILSGDVLTNPVTLYQLADAATRSLTVDPSLDNTTALIALGLQMRSIRLADVDFVTAPWRYDGARVDLVEPDTNVMWSLLRSDRTLEGQDASGNAPTGPIPSDPASGASERLALVRPGVSASASPSTSATSTPSSVPAPIPSGITDNLRRADADPCSNLSYGN